MKNNGIGALVALEMDRVVDSPDFIKMFTKHASACCAIDCDCKTVGGKCPCKKENKKCEASCKACGTSTEAEPMAKDASSVMEEAANLILEASVLLESQGFDKASTAVMKSLDYALNELAVVKFAKDKKDDKVEDKNSEDSNDAKDFSMFDEIDRIDSDADSYLQELKEKSKKRSNEEMLAELQQELAELDADVSIHNRESLFDEADGGEPLFNENFEELDVNDAKTTERLGLPEIYDDPELDGEYSERYGQEESKILEMLDAMSNDEDPIKSEDIDTKRWLNDNFGHRDTVLSLEDENILPAKRNHSTKPSPGVEMLLPEDDSELFTLNENDYNDPDAEDWEYTMAFEKLDHWISKNASKEDEEESEEESEEDEDFEVEE